MENYSEIEFELPFHIRAPDGFEKPQFEFFPRVDAFPIGLRFRTKCPGQITIGGLGTVRNDRYGRAVRSEVRAKFHPAFEKKVPRNSPDKGVYPAGTWLGDRDGYYIQAAVAALNKFISIYREESGSYWVRSLEPGDIGEFEIREIEDGDVASAAKRTVTRDSTSLGGFGEKELNNIERRLENRELPNIYQTLHLDTREKIQQGEHGIAIVLAYLLFERWVKNAFIQTVTSNGSSHGQAIGLIKKGNGNFSSLSNILKNIIPHRTGVDFQNSSVFDEWDRRLRKERTKVVHENYRPSGKSALRAHSASIQAIEWFQEKFGSGLDNSPESVEFVDLD